MPGTILIEDRTLLMDSGAIVQIRIWQLPEETKEWPHGLRYSLYYGRAGERIVGYDNEAGNEDRRHYRGRERAYRFTTYRSCLADFWQDVRKEIEREGSRAARRNAGSVGRRHNGDGRKDGSRRT
ncbi:MAG TPA: DUF6516 family protein [Gammaproteobacteria bacterium]